ncbi:hypothetical protein [Streptomyces sp. NPDC059783]|uniref:DUF7848 domain-containing protein n=1 Tax=Streptomyces sp. NPDC059783 TaxID=3346944 RepID=UPI0036609C34
MTRSVIRHADWSIGLATGPDGPGPVYQMECTACGQVSEAATGKDSPEVWALRHTGLHTSHRTYRAITTSYCRVTPAPGNPLAAR